MAQTAALNRSQRRALMQADPAAMSGDAENSESRYFSKALLLAFKGDCACRPCKILRKMAGVMMGPEDDDDDDDD